MTFEEKAFAKLNLCLDVGEKLPDGYHAVRGIMQSTDFCDDVRLTPGDGPWQVGSNLSYLPTGETNLAARAALLFRQETGLGPEGGSISLTKRIPVCGGYGGGSSDAAAVLRIMNRLSGSPLSWAELEELSIPLGADVPFCIRGGTALAAGKGEKLNPLPAFDGRALVLCRPDFSCSTPQLFKALDARKIRLRPDVGHGGSGPAALQCLRGGLAQEAAVYGPGDQGPALGRGGPGRRHDRLRLRHLRRLFQRRPGGGSLRRPAWSGRRLLYGADHGAAGLEWELPDRIRAGASAPALTFSAERSSP